ncbi:MAG: DNRLRE domain-containing protein [Lentisphaeraceae bacterium]|nr:DNRLRE domain-containing protein [Lentisphaeraceae bacterium]
MTEKQEEQLYLWIEQQRDDLLSKEDSEKLERLILEDEEARKVYLDVTTANAMLFEQGLELESPAATTPKTLTYYKFALLAAAAMLAFMFIRTEPKQTFPEAIAVLTKTEDCVWKDSSLPTNSGSPLTAGNLNLVQGLATVKFNSGAELIIEAPAEVEFIDSMNCLVKHGTVMADVPESAHGFTIDTPKAKAIDHGTKFVVSYNKKSEKSLVEVLEGEVEVKANAEDESERFFEGNTAIIEQDKMRKIDSVGEADKFSEARKSEPETIKITTADGLGSDQAIDYSKTTHNKHVHFLTVKNTNSDLRRKFYIKFDVASLETFNIKSVKLRVRAVPSDYGKALLLPPVAKFSVYGLTDESGDGWDENSITWKNAPANTNKGNELQKSKVKLIGEFSFSRSVQDRLITLESADLLEFITADTNGLVTFIIVRESEEYHRDGYVHAFASKEHPVNSPPTLEFEINK